MPDRIVINTGPVLAIIAGTGSLNILNELYDEVYIPLEVRNEILRGGKFFFGVNEFQNVSFYKSIDNPVEITLPLLRTIDTGEASVIQTAINNRISKVAINETAGRRVARLSGLEITGSIGILIRAKNEKLIPSIQECIQKMRSQGIWLSDNVIKTALKETGEE